MVEGESGPVKSTGERLHRICRLIGSQILRQQLLKYACRPLSGVVSVALFILTPMNMVENFVSLFASHLWDPGAQVLLACKSQEIRVCSLGDSLKSLNCQMLLPRRY